MCSDQKRPLKVKGQVLDVESLGSSFEYIWCIKDFPTIFSDGPDFVELESPVFLGDPKDPNLWKLHFRGFSKDSTGYAALQLVHSNSYESLTIQYAINALTLEFGVLDNLYHPRKCFACLTPGDSIKFHKLYDPYDNNRRPVKYLSIDDTLRIHCSVMVVEEGKPTTMNQLVCCPTDQMVVNQKFKSFLQNGSFSDVTLTTPTSSFPVSKVILAGHSDVFETMFMLE